MKKIFENLSCGSKQSVCHTMFSIALPSGVRYQLVSQGPVINKPCWSMLENVLIKKL